MLVCVASIKGAPGVTSTALALASVWPRPVTVVEADPSGGDLAYRCQAMHGGPLRGTKGLLTMAAAVRGGTPEPRVVLEHAQPLACGVDVVQGVTSAGQARGLGGLWPALATACQVSTEDVLIDVGRLERTSPTLALARAADVVLPVAASSLASVMHLKHGLAELMPALVQRQAVTVTPIVIGPDAHAEQDCVDVNELLARAGHPVQLARPLTYDPRALVRLEEGEKGTGRLGRTLLLRRALAIAASLVGPDDGPTGGVDGEADRSPAGARGQAGHVPAAPGRVARSWPERSRR